MSRGGELVVTVTLRGESLHPFVVPNTVTYSELKRKIERMVGKSHLRLQYIDRDGQLMCLDTEEKLISALMVAHKCDQHLQVVVCDQQQTEYETKRTQSHHHHHSHYPELAECIGAKRQRAAKKAAKMLLGPQCSTDQQQYRYHCHRHHHHPVEDEPAWFKTATEKQATAIVDGVLKGLNGAVIASVREKPPVVVQAGGDYGVVIHDGVVCDACDGPVIGARYKCGNCLDYDLCEKCETQSQHYHDPSHVFLKFKRPARNAGLSKKGHLKPLLKKNVYRHCWSPQDMFNQQPELQLVKEGEKEKVEYMKKEEAEEKRADNNLDQEEKEEEEEDEEEQSVVNRRKTADGYVVCNREQLRQQLEAKQRKKKRKSHESSTTSAKGHGKCLDSKFIADTSYPDESTVYYGQQFDKGWIVENSGTKRWKHVTLVHQQGFAPIQPFVTVPELAPGEQTELIISYPSIIKEDGQSIRSSLRLCHKGVPFGCSLWLSVIAKHDPVDQLVDTFEQVPCPLIDSSTGFAAPPDPAPSAPPAPADDEEEGFMFVEQPTPDLSLFTFTSTFPGTRDEEEEEEEEEEENKEGKKEDESLEKEEHVETASFILSNMDNSSGFVVVIPECFNLDVPLAGFQPPHATEDKQEEEKKEVTHNAAVVHVTPSCSESTATPVPVPVPEPQPQPVSPNTARRREFVPDRVTLQRLWSRKSTDPLRYATGLVNTVSDLVSKHVKVATTCTMDNEEEEPYENEEEEEEEEEDEEDTTENEGFETVTTQSSAAAPREVAQFVQRRDVSAFLNRKWEGLNPPATPMDKLISMGFADRDLNARLLVKHNNNLTTVLNELLDTDGMGYQPL